jgi:SAM-dependent methyltransferase
MAAPSAVFDRLSALADPTRARVLLVLERHELTVGELAAVLQLPQSTTSRHLKTLGDEGWVTSRAEGASRYYTFARLDASARRLWGVVREEVAAGPGAAHDAKRLERILADRRARSREFFSASAAQWGRVREELFGAHADLVALLGLLDDRATVADLGTGTGQFAATIAPYVAQVLAVDASAAMLAAARRRVAPHENVDLRQGELESLPVEDGEADLAVLLLVLHYLAEPAAALAEAARVVKPGGRLLVVDMMPHDREEYRQQMGHVWLGFSSEQLASWLEPTGLERLVYRALPADPAAKGPTLFAATARKS